MVGYTQTIEIRKGCDFGGRRSSALTLPQQRYRRNLSEVPKRLLLPVLIPGQQTKHSSSVLFAKGRGFSYSLAAPANLSA